MEDRIYTRNHSGLFPESEEQQRKNREALRAAYGAATAGGGSGWLHYVAAETQLGDDGEDAVDGSHPTDLGFVRQARALVQVLESVLGRGRL